MDMMKEFLKKMRNNKMFNWDRFFGELEEGDPRKFPFWMFMYHEFVSIISNIIVGIILSFFILIIIGTTLSTLANYYPDFTFSLFYKSVCEYKLNGN